MVATLYVESIKLVGATFLTAVRRLPAWDAGLIQVVVAGAQVIKVAGQLLRLAA